MSALAQTFPIAELEGYARILLYPAASGASYFMDFLRQQAPHLLQRVAAMADQDPNKQGLQLEGLPIVAPEAIPGVAPDAIVVCSPAQYASMRLELSTRVGPDIPIFQSDWLAEYLLWEGKRSVLSAWPFSAAHRETFPFAAAPLFFHSFPIGSSASGRACFTQSVKGALTFRLLDQVRFPEDLTGKRVLDLGAADGFYSLEAKARGAAHVDAVDWLYWRHGDGLKRLGWVREGYGLEVVAHVRDVDALQPDTFEPADLVLLLGLYYHLQNPLQCFTMLRHYTRGQAIISGRTVRLPVPDPFHPGAKHASVMVLSDRNQGKWTATTRCLLDMLLLAGFSRAEVVLDDCPPGSTIASTAIHAFV